MISVVLPAFNEQENIPHLYERLTACARTWNEPYEIIVVNDGSRDATLAMCASYAANDPCFKVLSFSRNFGHPAAITAGLRFSSGDLVAILDSDLQDPPEELVRFFAKCREGYDVVYAVRTKRKEGILKRASYFIYYRLLAALATFDIPLDSGDFCVMSRRVVQTLNALPERNRFVRGLRSWIGFRQTGLEYERHARAAGEPKYTFRKLLNLALDGIFNFSYKPLRVITLTGIGVGALAMLRRTSVPDPVSRRHHHRRLQSASGARLDVAHPGDPVSLRHAAVRARRAWRVSGTNLRGDERSGRCSSSRRPST